MVERAIDSVDSTQRSTRRAITPATEVHAARCQLSRAEVTDREDLQ